MTSTDRRKRPSGALYLVPVVSVLLGCALGAYSTWHLLKSTQPPRTYFAITKRIAIPHPLRFALCFQSESNRDDRFTEKRVEDRFRAATFTFANAETGRTAQVTALRGQTVYAEWGIRFHGLKMRRALVHGMQLAVVDIDTPGVYAFTVSGVTDGEGSGRLAACEILPDKILYSAMLIASLTVLLIGGVGSTIVIHRRRTIEHSRKVALTLAVFGGFAGLDRFYLGYPGMGLLKLMTGGLFLVLWIRDIVKIARGTMRDKQGNYLE